MSSLSAILVVAGLFLIGLIPLALAATGIIGRAPAAICNGLLILGVTGYQASLFASSDLQLPDAANTEGNAVPQAQCVELIAALEQGRIILDRRTPPRLIVSRDRWSQLPEEAAGAILDCVHRTWPAGTAAPELEVRAD